MFMHSRTIAAFTVLAISFLMLLPGKVSAMSSLSRLYKMSCLGCHSTMPRLNYFGEKLLLRGYELDKMSQADLPVNHTETESVTCTSCHNSGSVDPNGEVGAAQYASDLFLHDVSNYLSIRYKISALEVKTNDLTEGSEKKTRVSVGKMDWVQFWVAGPIAKNIAIRTEAELADGKSVGLHNYALAYSDLIPKGALNVRVGGFTHGEWLSISDQKRAFSPHFSIFEVKSAQGKPVDGAITSADTFKVAGAEPAIEFYGYNGPLVYQVGVSNGKSANDVNADKNYWGTVKWYTSAEGSSVSASYLTGTDSNTAVSQKDKFRRYIVAGNLRRGPLDLAGAYVTGKDDNWDLSTGVDNTFHGGFAQALYTLNDKVTLGGIYQRTTSDDPSIEKNSLLLGVNYYIRQNAFISTYYDADLLSTSATHPDKKNTFVIQLRGMF